jgi:8-oxo-dGTP diphosphatase
MTTDLSKQKPIIKAASACVWRNGEVLLIKRGNELGKGYWSFPGGKTEAGELAQACAIRELREETGLDVELKIQVGDFTVETKEAVYLISCFTGNYSNGTATAGTDADDVAWVSLGNLTQYRLTPQVLQAMALAFKLINL